MAFTYDPTIDRGRVRLLIPDRVEPGHFFEDDEVDALLAMHGQDVRLAAAEALDTLASSEAYVQKVIKLLDLATNGAQTAQALMARAKVLRQQVADEMERAENEVACDWAEMAVDTFSAREIILKGALRRG